MKIYVIESQGISWTATHAYCATKEYAEKIKNRYIGVDSVAYVREIDVLEEPNGDKE